eukprot:maker-scaffold_4-snap-gene-18.49-mRNA-1 protein AED:0.00 eAED:0.00 QI:134/1/1/1/1/1/2/141/540
MKNINIGIFGHVDSGKTSIAKVLSTRLSTASLDKNPQSQERGITIDLGFSSFEYTTDNDRVRVTLVDSPGHASLIKTVIGAVGIIDKALLILDATKGIQVQTIECIALASIIFKSHLDLIIICNKIDLVPEAERESVLQKTRTQFRGTKFSSSKIIPFSCTQDLNIYARNLTDTALKNLSNEVLQVEGESLFLNYDHCFNLKGKGTVLTGTIIWGELKVNQEIFIDKIQTKKKIKSVQSFHEQVASGKKGDRVALLVSSLDSTKLERGIVFSSEGSVNKTQFLVISAKKLKFYTKQISSREKYHISLSLAHATELAEVIFFGRNQIKSLVREEKNMVEAVKLWNSLENKEFEYDEQLFSGGKSNGGSSLQFALLHFQSPILIARGGLKVKIIGSKLDFEAIPDVETTYGKNALASCRIAFHGEVLETDFHKFMEKKVKIYKSKQRFGEIERFDKKGSVYSCIVKGFLNKESAQSQEALKYIQSGKILIEGEEHLANIESRFGKSGKVRMVIQNTADYEPKEGHKVELRLKKHIPLEQLIK